MLAYLGVDVLVVAAAAPCHAPNRGGGCSFPESANSAALVLLLRLSSFGGIGCLVEDLGRNLGFDGHLAQTAIVSEILILLSHGCLRLHQALPLLCQDEKGIVGQNWYVIDVAVGFDVVEKLLGPMLVDGEGCCSDSYPL